MEKQIWIGLVSVTPIPGSQALGGAKGAFVNALALAADESEYQRAVQQTLESLGLVASEFEDVEVFPERTRKWHVDKATRLLAEEVRITGSVRLGTFHNYHNLE